MSFNLVLHKSFIIPVDPPLPKGKNRGYFLRVISNPQVNLAKSTLFAHTCCPPLTPATHTHSLPHHPESEWYICYNRRMYTDTSLSPKVPSACQGSSLDVKHSVGFDKCKIPCTQHYSIWNSLTVLKMLCGMFLQPFLLPNPWQPLIFS